jgi:hypothetical protein
MENQYMEQRWNKKVEDEWKRKYKMAKNKLKELHKRPLTKYEKIGAAINVFEEEYNKNPEPKNYSFDLRDSKQREDYEQTNDYVFYYLTEVLPRSKTTIFNLPSKRDRELANELGYEWKNSDLNYRRAAQGRLTDNDRANHVYYILVPVLDNLDELLQDACFKYGFAYDGILREQKLI